MNEIKVPTDQLVMVNRRRRWFSGRVAVWLMQLGIADIWPFCHIWEPLLKNMGLIYMTP